MTASLEQQTRRLLYHLRKQMNGDALDRMLCYGEPYARNYGVQIYALRDVAREVGCNHSLAVHLREQNVRELRIIAVWIADVEVLDSATIAPWLNAITNSELAEQTAHALLSRYEGLAQLLCDDAVLREPFVAYALLLAASRCAVADMEVVQHALAALDYHPNNALVARAAVAWLSVLDNPHALLEQLPDTPTARLVREEMSWR